MESLSMSLKYILDSTKAYKNGFITKSEYKVCYIKPTETKI